MKIASERIGKLAQICLRNCKEVIKKQKLRQETPDALKRLSEVCLQALDRHAPQDPHTAALVGELLAETNKFLARYFDGPFKQMMTEKYGIEYPLNINVKDEDE